MNFLDLIWLIPLFPLCGAVLMLLFGRLLDPQPPSTVALAPGVEHDHDDHDHHHDHQHGHSHGHVITTTATIMATNIITYSRSRC